MPIKFGINSLLWTADFGPGHFHLLPAIREHDFDGIEIAVFRPAGFQSAAVRRALEENGLECTICSVIPRDASPISSDARSRAKARAYLVDCIRCTAETGAHLLVGPLYSPVGVFTGDRRSPDEWKAAIELYQSLEADLVDHNVEICVEPLNRFETYFLNTTADTVRFCEEVGNPRVGMLWDSFHANIEEKHGAAALKATGSHLKHVHTCENDRGTPGSGHVDWEGIFSALDSLGYSGWLTIESFGFAMGELSAAASIWRDLAAAPEVIAWHGIAFLREMAAGAGLLHPSPLP